MEAALRSANQLCLVQLVIILLALQISTDQQRLERGAELMLPTYFGYQLLTATTSALLSAEPVEDLSSADTDVVEAWSEQVEELDPKTPAPLLDWLQEGLAVEGEVALPAGHVVRFQQVPCPGEDCPAMYERRSDFQLSQGEEGTEEVQVFHVGVPLPFSEGADAEFVFVANGVPFDTGNHRSLLLKDVVFFGYAAWDESELLDPADVRARALSIARDAGVYEADPATAFRILMERRDSQTIEVPIIDTRVPVRLAYSVLLLVSLGVAIALRSRLRAAAALSPDAAEPAALFHGRRWSPDGALGQLMLGLERGLGLAGYATVLLAPGVPVVIALQAPALERWDVALFATGTLVTILNAVATLRPLQCVYGNTVKARPGKSAP